MIRKVIYTSLVGKYDSLTNPRHIMPNWDYICFSNNIKKREGSIWEIRPIPFQHTDNTILSRYPKMNPHLVLSEYEYSLYIDANIIVLDNHIELRIDELINQKITLSLIPHPIRNCIYKEAEICIEDGVERKKTILKQVKFLKNQKFPENVGLFENGIIFRNHNDQTISSLDTDWWNLYLKFSKRDQLSLCYLLWKNNIYCEPFTPKGISVRNHPSFCYVIHKRTLIQRTRMFIQRNINKYL